MIRYSCDCCKRDISEEEPFWAGNLSMVDDHTCHLATYGFHFCGNCCQDFTNQFDLKPINRDNDREEE